MMMMNANVCLNRWNTYVVDGHDVEALCNAFLKASSVKDKPTCILAKTFKGRGIPGVEDLDNWHGKPIGNKGKEVMDFIGQQIHNQGPSGLHPCPPSENVAEIEFGGVTLSEPPSYKLDEQVQSLMSCNIDVVQSLMSCNHWCRAIIDVVQSLMSCNHWCRAMIDVVQSLMSCNHWCRAIIDVMQYWCRAIIDVMQSLMSCNHWCRAIIDVVQSLMSCNHWCRAIIDVVQSLMSCNHWCRAIIDVVQLLMSCNHWCHAILN